MHGYNSSFSFFGCVLYSFAELAGVLLLMPCSDVNHVCAYEKMYSYFWVYNCVAPLCCHCPCMVTWMEFFSRLCVVGRGVCGSPVHIDITHWSITPTVLGQGGLIHISNRLCHCHLPVLMDTNIDTATWPLTTPGSPAGDWPSSGVHHPCGHGQTQVHGCSMSPLTIISTIHVAEVDRERESPATLF